ncbi:hypothetical protein SAV14893_087730 [Streptomyces avermitilis]|uniref:WYL domain-containing protein n=1 Tax=Streptomyces avermitilis TaxID=33903 RepID=A0A4D4MBR9_STRAX|nr:hypothetical protein SAVMC3_08830 [Streptomyces avermitilis]GDY69380.1 hypothetical protein SAV14893_087730 [Streptomyces avermitilis]
MPGPAATRSKPVSTTRPEAKYDGGGSSRTAASLDAVLMHVLLLGYDFEILDPPELGGRCRALAERLLAAGATVSPAPDIQES